MAMTAERLTKTNVQVDSADPSQIRRVLLADGQWHTTDGVQLIQFALGTASSPVNPPKLYPYLRFKSDKSGGQITVPIAHVQAFDIGGGTN